MLPQLHLVERLSAKLRFKKKIPKKTLRVLWSFATSHLLIRIGNHNCFNGRFLHKFPRVCPALFPFFVRAKWFHRWQKYCYFKQYWSEEKLSRRKHNLWVAPEHSGAFKKSPRGRSRVVRQIWLHKDTALYDCWSVYSHLQYVGPLWWRRRITSGFKFFISFFGFAFTISCPL